MLEAEEIAESVYREMKKNGAGKDELVDYLKDAYDLIYSEDIDIAQNLITRVRLIVLEKLEEEESN